MSATTYPLYTILNVHIVDNIEYAATITQTGVWQIKGKRGPIDDFSTVEEWLSTLPGSPTIDEVTVAYQYVEPAATEQNTKKKTKKKETWNVPTKHTRIRSVRYARYVYNMIKECDKKHNTGLLQRNDIRNAYHHFVSVLESLESLETYEPRSYSTQTNGLSIEDLRKHSYIGYSNLKPSDACYPVIVDAYRPLYDLYKDVMGAWVEQSRDDMIDENDIKENRRYRNRYIQEIDRLTKNYNEKLARLHTKITRYQQIIDNIQNKKRTEQ